jgi:hypothetical protein
MAAERELWGLPESAPPMPAQQPGRNGHNRLKGKFPGMDLSRV